MKFDIEQYKKNPKRKLIIRNHRQDKPQVWPVEEIQIGLGNIIIIKTPDTGYATDEYQALDGDVLKDKNNNPVGTLYFANEKLTMLQFIENLESLPVDYSFDFFCSENVDAVRFGVTKLKRFDTELLLFAKYGGGNGCVGCYDVGEKIDAKDMENYLACYLEDQIEEFFYISSENHSYSKMS